jgi:hypothetical protein
MANMLYKQIHKKVKINHEPKNFPIRQLKEQFWLVILDGADKRKK